ncbi:hypothetical protein CBR_g10788 [Chara braunii]|uniref:Uncharacterized protein n=1 Tax=Chara braunii TaxID=69332 RepID=A0A388KP61_CHABU|nr:hypothetical protein CBR_g10788 [Chara braunii]|eukprot:GBG71850.1 hypothetical protein CBR_g10788 [Chara braunii]
MAASVSPCSQCIHVSGTTCDRVSRGARVLTTVSSQSKEASFVPSPGLSSICSPKLAGFSSSSFSPPSVSRQILSRAFASLSTSEFCRRHLHQFPGCIKGAFPPRTPIDIDSPRSDGLTTASWSRSTPVQCSAIERYGQVHDLYRDVQIVLEPSE